MCIAKALHRDPVFGRERVDSVEKLPLPLEEYAWELEKLVLNLSIRVYLESASMQGNPINTHLENSEFYIKVCISFHFERL